MSIAFVNLNIILSVFYIRALIGSFSVTIKFQLHLKCMLLIIQRNLCVWRCQKCIIIYSSKKLWKKWDSMNSPFSHLQKNIQTFNHCLAYIRTVQMNRCAFARLVYTFATLKFYILHNCYIEMRHGHFSPDQKKRYSRKITEGYPPVMVAITTRGHCPIPVPCP